MAQEKSLYKEAGVDIDAGNYAVELMKRHVASTMRPEVLGGIGGFSGLFTLDLSRYPKPVLVAGTDGVGTKLKIAQMVGKHDTVGIDLVAMCVNDILVTGAEPLFYLDYLACGKLEPRQAEEVVAGVAAGCREAGCALLGGETAEMPDFYPEGEYDLAGFAVGVVNRDAIWDGNRIAAGDLLIGLASSGVHSNGYSLVRHILFKKCGLSVGDPFAETGRTLGEELLTPTRIYVKSVLAAKEKVGGLIKGAAHITGGGMTENIPRVLPMGLGVEIHRGKWPVPPIFYFLKQKGDVQLDEMYRVFNMGIGFVLIADKNGGEEVLKTLQGLGEEAYIIGQVIEGAGVRYVGEGE
ncbi:MAG: phosphoribosylformylglycinamidine cyclo-ligase [Thermacetogeniaceae bacterium]|jgi:phosphoribosylformylglycinamidine cyclo-ligase|nr:phosphoribosylformylglycinamidine cyclo-ligase [Syntrophomonadaceae bacterium]